MPRHIPVLCLVLGLVGCQSSPKQPVFSEASPPRVELLQIKWPDPQVDFDPNGLLEAQLSLCAAFRDAAGNKCRKAEFDALMQADALPYNTKRLTREHVVALLGLPEVEDQRNLIYRLGACEGRMMSCMLMLHEGRLVSWGIASTM